MISEAAGQFIDVLSQARRRAATQMELLYASSGDLTCESPTGDFPSPLPALLERQEGLPDPQSQGLGQTQDREQAVSPSPLAPRAVTMSVFKATTPSEVLCGAFGVIFFFLWFVIACRSGSRTPTGSERRLAERSPLSRRKQTPPTTHTTAAAHTPSASTAEAVAKTSDYQSL